MILPTLRYIHADYWRSQRFFPPALLYALAIVWVYAIVPNPVESSYAFSAALLFPVSAWLALGGIDAEARTQQIVSALHAGNRERYVAIKLAYFSLLPVALGLFAMLYPAAVGAFDRATTPSDLGFAFLSHASASFLGGAIGICFSSRMLSKLSTSLPLLLTTLALALAAEGVRDELPGMLAHAAWALPPIASVVAGQYTLAEGEPTGFLLVCLGSVGYALLLLALYIVRIRRNGL